MAGMAVFVPVQKGERRTEMFGFFVFGFWFRIFGGLGVVACAENIGSNPHQGAAFHNRRFQIGGHAH